MSEKRVEILAVIATGLGIVAAMAWPFVHEALAVRTHLEIGAQVVDLTGVSELGVWTDRRILAMGQAGAIPSARPVLERGRKTVFRFKSADVHHSFYSPELGIGPIEVYPGKLVEIEFTPTTSGTFEYYCTTVCGNPHFGMHGKIVVVEPGAKAPPPEKRHTIAPYWRLPPPADPDIVTRGGWLFRQKGCFNCHGWSGQGGVRNFNYVNDTVPSLDTLAERLYLFDAEDTAAIVDLLAAGTALEDVVDEAPVGRYRAVLAKYTAVREVIRKGNVAGRKDPEGPKPPLDMPPWQDHLSARDIDALIAYLLSLQYPDAVQAPS